MSRSIAFAMKILAALVLLGVLWASAREPIDVGRAHTHEEIALRGLLEVVGGQAEFFDEHQRFASENESILMGNQWSHLHLRVDPYFTFEEGYRAAVSLPHREVKCSFTVRRDQVSAAPSPNHTNCRSERR